MSADGRISISVAAGRQLRGAIGLGGNRTSKFKVKFSNGELMGIKINLKRTNVHGTSKTSVNKNTTVSMSLTANVAGESKVVIIFICMCI